MKIKILYSHLNVSGNDFKGRPEWFDFEKCFKNFLNTIEKWTDVELHLIYDTTRGNIEQNWINQYKDKYILHEIEGGTMEKAAIEMYKIAKELSNKMEDSDVFMFQENDYLFCGGWDNEIRTLYQTFGELNYITLYNHGDKYILPQYEDLVSKVFVTKTHHWCTTPSTCGSYICSKKIFLEDYDVHTNIMGDHNKNILLYETKGRHILMPLPSLSTHLVEPWLAPCIDWEKI